MRFSVLGVCSHARGLSGRYGASQRPSRPSVERIHALSSNPSAQNLAASTHPCALLIKILLGRLALNFQFSVHLAPGFPLRATAKTLRNLVPTHSGQPCAGRRLTYRVCRSQQGTQYLKSEREASLLRHTLFVVHDSRKLIPCDWLRLRIQGLLLPLCSSSKKKRKGDKEDMPVPFYQWNMYSKHPRSTCRSKCKTALEGRTREQAS
ncbi:uncharacterized protein LOC109490591 isoform X2 [Ailuropoda melanoleuca]|uniref:uncharacterized protein LOC109490591 isoform X2 n=1 Tax=Ailuropoda melanoleuca TaxID=9646 RepID=UPI000947E3CB|nr:uncharacterized protein LOC109490591 isoform X2 [Ailuropoda melanoleuca]